MSESIRRRRRKRTDSTEVDLSIITPTESSPPSNVTESDSDDGSSNEPQITIDSNITSHQATIDRIRSEINEDNYHSQLNEPEYSNDTHNWSDEQDVFSSDYWHFLGVRLV